MRHALLLAIVAVYAVPGFAADPAQCDATAFTLKKPVPPASKVDKPQSAAKPVIAQVGPTKPKPKTTNRLISDCKDGKKKKSG